MHNTVGSHHRGDEYSPLPPQEELTVSVFCFPLSSTASIKVQKYMGRKGICITFMSRERYMEKETQLGTVVTEHWIKLKLASRHNKDHDKVTLREPLAFGA